MKNCGLWIVFALMALPVLGAGKVDYLYVNQTMVIFSTHDNKTATSPACVVTANANKWALSLDSDTGRAMYSMLMTAMATDITIAVETAGDCAGAEGDERPKRVWFDASAAVKANPVTPVETITTYKTVAYAADMGGTVQTTLKAPTGRYYMGRSNIANGSVCYCLDGSKMVKVAGTGNKSCPAGTTNRYASYRQYVIEVDAPLVTS